MCTLPGSPLPDGGTCNAVHSPADEPWLYSYGHWVETDGTFSSPGLFGFYPWIDKGKKYYGIVARESLEDLDGAPKETPYGKSVRCGQAIRRAFLAAQ